MSGARTWFVDPVDGTYNFLSGLPVWCSAIALADGDGRVARRGLPADRGRAVARRPRAPDDAQRHGRRAAGRPAARAGLASRATCTRRRCPTTACASRCCARCRARRRVRMLGSGSIELASVAAGRLGALGADRLAALGLAARRALVRGGRRRRRGVRGARPSLARRRVTRRWSTRSPSSVSVGGLTAQLSCVIRVEPGVQLGAERFGAPRRAARCSGRPVARTGQQHERQRDRQHERDAARRAARPARRAAASPTARRTCRSAGPCRATASPSSRGSSALGGRFVGGGGLVGHGSEPTYAQMGCGSARRSASGTGAVVLADHLVAGVALHRAEPGVADEREQVVAGQLVRRAEAVGVVGDLVLDHRAVHVVRAVVQRELRGRQAVHHPEHLDVREVVEHQPRHRERLAGRRPAAPSAGARAGCCRCGSAAG